LWDIYNQAFQPAIAPGIAMIVKKQLALLGAVRLISLSCAWFRSISIDRETLRIDRIRRGTEQILLTVNKEKHP
jgi:hypothetical protein